MKHCASVSELSSRSQFDLNNNGWIHTNSPNENCECISFAFSFYLFIYCRMEHRSHVGYNWCAALWCIGETRASIAFAEYWMQSEMHVWANVITFHLLLSILFTYILLLFAFFRLCLPSTPEYNAKLSASDFRFFFFFCYRKKVLKVEQWWALMLSSCTSIRVRYQFYCAADLKLVWPLLHIRSECRISLSWLSTSLSMHEIREQICSGRSNRVKAIQLV